MAVESSATEPQLPAVYAAADSAAGSAQKAYLSQIRWSLLFAVFGALASSFTGSDGMLIVAAAIFIGALSLSVAIAFRKFDEHWYSARALAESIKTRSWRYMMRSKPYDQSDAEARVLFIKELRAFLQSNQSVARFSNVECCIADPLPASMGEVRARAAVDRAKVYLASRIDEQKRWYSTKARTNEAGARRWLGAVIGTNALAVILLLTSLAVERMRSVPIEVLGAVAASALSWLQVRKFRESAVSYKLAAHEISLIAAESPSEPTEVALSSFVNDAENAFSREHTQWLARKDQSAA